MSRGAGRVQRIILDQVAELGYCLLKDVPAAQPSVSRAAGRLCRGGEVDLWYYHMKVPDRKSTWKNHPVSDREVAIAFRAGIPKEERREIYYANLATDAARAAVTRPDGSLKSAEELQRQYDSMMEYLTATRPR